MNRWMRVCVCVVWGFLFSCSLWSAEKPINVLVSIPPLAEFVRAVGQDHVDVRVFLPKGVSPHDYSPKPSQMRDLQHSELLFFLHSGWSFEEMALRALPKKDTGNVVFLGLSVQLLAWDGKNEEGHAHGHDHGDYDPHIWLSLVNAQKMVVMIEQELSRRYPQWQADFQRGSQAYREKLQQLDKELHEQVQRVHMTQLCVIHPAWGYFASNYGLEQVALEQYGQEPSAKHMTAYMNILKKEPHTIILVDPVEGMNAAKAISASGSWTRVEVNTLSEEFLDMMGRIRDAMKHRRIS